MAEKLIIKKFRKKDAIKVSRLCRKCIREINSKDITKKQTAALLKYHSSKNILKSSKANIYIAVVKNKIVGTATLSDDQIKTVFVHQNYQGKGIGAKLMKHIEQKAKKTKSVFLRSSPYAVNFYKKLGYKKIKNIYSPEIGKIILMKKKLF